MKKWCGVQSKRNFQSAFDGFMLMVSLSAPVVTEYI